MNHNIIFGKYQKLSLLGSGGMGQVFLIKRIDTGKVYAMKVMEDDRRSRRERDILKELSGVDGIPVFYEYKIKDGKLYLIMDYIPGVSMKQFIDIRGKPKEKQIIFWGKELCRILETLHKDLRIAYMDLKPANIIVHPSGKLYLLDFGISVRFGDMMDCCGTKEFAAPEQFHTFVKADALSDVYSFGKVLEFCCPTEKKADIQRVIKKCIEKDSEHRYQTMGEIYKELCRISRKRNRNKIVKESIVAIFFIVFMWITKNNAEKVSRVSVSASNKAYLRVEAWKKHPEKKISWQQLWKDLEIYKKDALNFKEKYFLVETYMTYSKKFEKYGDPWKRAKEVLKEMEQMVLPKKKKEQWKEILQEEKMEILEHLAERGEIEEFSFECKRCFREKIDERQAWKYYCRYLIFQEKQGSDLCKDYENFIDRYPKFSESYMEYTIYLCRHKQWEKAKKIYMEGMKHSEMSGMKAKQLKEKLGL